MAVSNTSKIRVTDINSVLNTVITKAKLCACNCNWCNCECNYCECNTNICLCVGQCTCECNYCSCQTDGICNCNSDEGVCPGHDSDSAGM